MKRLFAVLLAMAMIFMVGSAFSATIDLKDVLDGETYTAYKILNYTQSGTAISYYLNAADYDRFGSVLEAAGFEFQASSDGNQYYVKTKEDFDAAGAAEYLSQHSDDLNGALGTYSATGNGGSAAFTDLPTGYYFVTSSLGTLCALHSDDEIATAVEKNTVPTEDKKQSTDGTTYTDDTLDFNMGDTVYYQVEITDGKGTNGDIILTDEMSDGLTFNRESITVTKDEATVDTSAYTVTTSEHGFVLTLKAAYVESLDESDVVTVKYTAKINENAVIDKDTNTNTATLTYSEQSQTDTVKLETYDILLKKVDENHFALEGAKFNLFTAAEGGEPLKFEKDDTGYYLSTASGAEAEIDAGDGTGVIIRGLAPGIYYFEETEVPDGYNKLSARESVEVKAKGESAVEITVVNQAGSELPSTGGMGTTIFYVIGGLLIIGAAVVLVARRKAQE